jgi:hypothetical protein
MHHLHSRKHGERARLLPWIDCGEGEGAAIEPHWGRSYEYMMEAKERNFLLGHFFDDDSNSTGTTRHTGCVVAGSNSLAWTGWTSTNYM